MRKNGYACDDVMNVTGFIVWASERVVRYCLPMGASVTRSYCIAVGGASMDLRRHESIRHT